MTRILWEGARREKYSSDFAMTWLPINLKIKHEIHLQKTRFIALHGEYTSLLLPGNRAYLVVFCNSNVHRRCIKKFSTKCVNNPQPFPWRKRGWVYFWSQIKACGCSLCEVRCCNAEKPVPGNNIVRQDCSGEHGELRDGQRCNVVGVASKELLPCIKWALCCSNTQI